MNKSREIDVSEKTSTRFKKWKCRSRLVSSSSELTQAVKLWCSFVGGVWSLGSVLNLLVPLQVAGVGEAAVADGTAERPLAGVHVAVDVQLALAHKALAAQLAGVGLLPGVPGHVFLQVRLQEEAFGAAGAAVRPLHGDGLVERQVEAVGRVRSCSVHLTRGVDA